MVKAKGSLHQICKLMVQDKTICLCVRVWLRIYELRRLTAPTQSQIKKLTYKTVRTRPVDIISKLSIKVAYPDPLTKR